MNERASVLAERIEHGAATLASFAAGLSVAEWQTVVPGDGRTVGVTVHHVANMYPIEVGLVQTLAAVRALRDEDLDRANNVSLNEDAPLTAQFFIEDHPLRHCWHHLAKMRAAIGNAVEAGR